MEIEATRTVSSMSIVAVPNTNREREGLYFKMNRGCTWLGQRHTVARHDCERLLAFWRSSVNGKPDSGLVLQWVSHKDTLKGELNCAGQRSQVQLPAKGQDRKCSLFPLNTAGQRDQKAENNGISGP